MMHGEKNIKFILLSSKCWYEVFSLLNQAACHNDVRKMYLHIQLIYYLMAFPATNRCLNTASYVTGTSSLLSACSRIRAFKFLIRGAGSVVGIATTYGLDSMVSNPGGGDIFHTCPHRFWGPPSLLYNGYLVFPGGKVRPGRDADLSPPSSAEVKNRVELYLYSS